MTPGIGLGWADENRPTDISGSVQFSLVHLEDLSRIVSRGPRQSPQRNRVAPRPDRSAMLTVHTPLSTAGSRNSISFCNDRRTLRVFDV